MQDGITKILDVKTSLCFSVRLAAMVSLAAVDSLSDDATVVLSPSAGEKEKAKKIAKAKGEKPESSAPIPKEKAKPVAKAKPKAKSKAKSDPSAASVNKSTVLKRPASAANGPVTASESREPALKKPAGRKKDVRANKSEYKRDGVWSVKLNEKEVIRVFRLQLACLHTCSYSILTCDHDSKTHCAFILRSSPIHLLSGKRSSLLLFFDCIVHVTRKRSPSYCLLLLSLSFLLC